MEVSITGDGFIVGQPETLDRVEPLKRVQPYRTATAYVVVRTALWGPSIVRLGVSMTVGGTAEIGAERLGSYTA